MATQVLLFGTFNLFAFFLIIFHLHLVESLNLEAANMYDLMCFVYSILSSFSQLRPGQLKGKRSSRMCLKALHKGEAVWQGLDTWIQGFPGGSDGKESARSAEDLGSVPGLGRSPGGGPSNPLQYSCLENPRGAWGATVHGVAKSQA